jgi:hypothetical protein
MPRHGNEHARLGFSECMIVTVAVTTEKPAGSGRERHLHCDQQYPRISKASLKERGVQGEREPSTTTEHDHCSLTIED